MKTLPNGLTIFNATPHVIRFWREDWDEPVEVKPDEKVDARPVELRAAQPRTVSDNIGHQEIEFVNTQFAPTPEGLEIVKQAIEDGADLIVGSIIAAQAYPGVVVAMTPAPGYERRPPAEKRMNPDKFTVF